MSSKRANVLMAILLALVLALVVRPHVEQWLWSSRAEPVAESPRGPDEVRSGSVRKVEGPLWVVDVEYDYGGGPGVGHIRVEVPSNSSGADSSSRGRYAGMVRVQPGRHRVSMELSHPGSSTPQRTSQLLVQLLDGRGRVVASRTLDQEIEWPDFGTWARNREDAKRSPDELLRAAVELIDSGRPHELARAQQVLQRLLERQADFDQAFVELARVAMKTNWGPEGLHQAATLLDSALKIRPESVNAKILLGYVYAHQGRHKDAEDLFAEVSRSEPRNLWLWTNWGEVLTLQGKAEPAMVKYREAITRPRTNDTYDRARLEAYRRLLELLDQRHDTAAMDALLRQRTSEYGAGSCFAADQARFLLERRAEVAEAMELARQAVNGQCGGAKGRTVLGLAHYLAWATGPDAQREQSLHQARVYLPSGPALIYQLASSDQLLVVARKLKAMGEPIDQFDNRGLNALAYALQQRDLVVASRLLRLGARTDTPIGEDKVPVALLPVMTADLEGVRLMRKAGADYSKLRYQGVTAVDMARRIGDRRLIELVDPRAQKT